ncbi:MAG: peroxidase family protein, partial [Myxococcota bacterium]
MAALQEGSPQGITPNTRERREDARNNREEVEPDTPQLNVRSYDGSGNNREDMVRGASFAHLERLTFADYGDGVSSPAGSARPSARAVSNAVAHQEEGVSLPNPFSATDFVWQWGQFIDHDIGLTDGTEEVFDIVVPPNDPDFDPFGTGEELIGFHRALFDEDTGSSSSNPREQENEISAWIDGSMVYGSSLERATALRDGAFLRMSDDGLLPLNSGNLANANGPVGDPTSLFLAGDVRANEQVGLTVMHTLFVREHNRLVRMMLDENPTMTADQAFEEARKLVIAEIQVITFNEFLPALIGPNTLPDYEGYNPSAHPGLFNEFSVAAFRLGHTLVNNQLLRVDAEGRVLGELTLFDAFFSAPRILTNGRDIEPILRGLATQLHQTADPKIVNDLRNMLFGPPGAGGLDLAALNVQRGRDHGVPSYNDVRDALGFGRAGDFSEITTDIERQAQLASVYDS